MSDVIFTIPLSSHSKAAAIVESLNKGNITYEEAERQLYILQYGKAPSCDILEKLHEIKQYKSPPFSSSDLYYQRDPWPKS